MIVFFSFQMRRLSAVVVLLCLAANVNPDDSREMSTCGLDETTCSLDDEAGPWTGLLREWALTATENNRHGKHIQSQNILKHMKRHSFIKFVCFNTL